MSSLSGPGEWGWSGDAAALDWNYGANPAAKDYALQYNIERNRVPGRDIGHERAVLRAQMETKGFRDDLAALVAAHGIKGILMGRRVLRDDPRFSLNPEPESSYNAAWAKTPLSSPLPERQALEQVIAQVVATPTPAAPSADGRDWKRMAGRYGLPALAALGAFAGLAALTGMEQPKQPVEVG